MCGLTLKKNMKKNIKIIKVSLLPDTILHFDSISEPGSKDKPFEIETEFPVDLKFISKPDKIVLKIIG